MARLESTQDLRQLAGMLASDKDGTRPRIVICAGTACQASGVNEVIRIAKKHIIQKDLHGKVGLRITGCHGFCEMGPFVLTEPQGAFYVHLVPLDVERIIDALVEGAVIEELLYTDPVSGKKCRTVDEIPFFTHQQRTLLGQNQKMDPIRIHDCIAQGGYGSLADVLDRGDARWVLDQVKASGLRGRGGAGFPTGVKWEMLAAEPSRRGKFLVCNADEGDPGAYMDEGILEGNPHSILEGMLIGAVATGATEGVIYVRAEYPLAIKHLTIALRQAREFGLLGKDILGTRMDFDISLVRGAGAFVCGEETALIRSIEGKTGEPRQRPPYPVKSGIEGKPTAINNVETWANVPVIFRMGAKAYSRIGTPGNSGTKIFSLVGKIKNTGLVEVPMGVPLGTIIHEIGGGPSGTARIKAVQTGGPSGGCIPADMFDLPIDYDSLASAGSIMGSGGMIVMDENTCMVDVARYYMAFLKDESCGKCFSCRKGTQRMYEILDDVTRGEATLEDLDLLEELAVVVKDASMCGLGQTASNPVLSTLRYFRDEYVEHIVDKRCRAFVCKNLTGAPCQAACPVGTEAWRYVAHIRRGEYEQAYRVIREANPFPSVCARVCNHPCEARCRAGGADGEAVAIRALKRFVTDRVDPSVYVPERIDDEKLRGRRVAVVGAGPAGLTAAHMLSLRGVKVTVFEAEHVPGGMLRTAIPPYRLPHDVVTKEIEALIDGNITLLCDRKLGRDVTLDGLLAEGFDAVYLAMGAHKSRHLGIAGEDAAGVIPGIVFLEAFNVKGEKLATGNVGVVGGGNSAVDAARTALRQPGVKNVTILYRRTREEMPAFADEVEAAIEEGVKLVTLVTPIEVLSEKGRLTGLVCITNTLGEPDSSGRRRPVPVDGSEHVVALDTLIVAISESAELDRLVEGWSGIEAEGTERIRADRKTQATGRPGVFAGGDVVTGPNTVIDAIAAGKKAAVAIARHLRGEELETPATRKLPEVFVPPIEDASADPAQAKRVTMPAILPDTRRRSFTEVELSLSEEEAIREASRCLRCDLEFTRPAAEKASGLPPVEEQTA